MQTTQPPIELGTATTESGGWTQAMILENPVCGDLAFCHTFPGCLAMGFPVALDNLNPLETWQDKGACWRQP